MEIITSSYRVVCFEEDFSDGIWTPKYDVFKEVSFFGISIYGKIVNNEAFLNRKDAEDFLKLTEDGKQNKKK